MLHRTFASAALALALSVVSLPATAETSDDAFQAGLAALGDAKYDEACAHFERAEQLDKPTVSTRYQLGRCNDERHNYFEAHDYFLDAARMAEAEGDTKRAEVARKRATELEERVPILKVMVPPEQIIDGLSIKIDDKAIPNERWGQPIAVRPGAHKLIIEAPGLETLTLDVTAPGEGEVATVQIPALQKAPPGVGGQPVTPGDDDDDDEEEKDDGPGRRSPALFWTGVGLTAAGGLGVLAGAVIAGTGEFEGAGEFIAPLVVGGAMLGVGIPFMVVFGATAEPEEAPPADAIVIQPIVGPLYGGLHVTF